jgi:uncharacterized protein (UPF0548 family)
VIRRPDSAAIARHLDAQRALPFTYDAVGATRELAAPAGFAIDHNTQQLPGSFDAAKRAIRAWAMFPAPWTAIVPHAPIVAGEVVAVLVRAGVWWLNAARIVYVIDEPVRFGFAYGTLPGHAECGEERFLVEQRDDGVYYDLYAFSRPHHWAARLGAPFARALQKKFARDSKAAMARSLRS